MRRDETPFIARRWKSPALGYGLTAILPTVPGSRAGMCLAYDLPGEHGDARPWFAMSMTLPANDSETELIALTLAERGYINPKPYKRITNRMLRELRKAHAYQHEALARMEAIA